LNNYTDAKGKGTPTLKAEKALEVLLEKLDVLRGLFHGFDYSKFEGTPAEVLALLPAAANHILGLGDKNEINGK
jgi:type I restriction enzyme, R subunit